MFNERFFFFSQFIIVFFSEINRYLLSWILMVLQQRIQHSFGGNKSHFLLDEIGESGRVNTFTTTELRTLYKSTSSASFHMVNKDKEWELWHFRVLKQLFSILQHRHHNSETTVTVSRDETSTILLRFVSVIS